MPVNVTMIRESFDLIKPNADEFLSHFYEYMFDHFPAAKPLFKGVDMPKQRKALAGALVFLIDNLEDSQKIENVLLKMGERHLGYGVEDDHYEIVGKSLLATFAYYLKEKWTDDLQNEWLNLYGVVADTMIKGAHQGHNSSANKVATDQNIQSILRQEVRSMIQDIYKNEISNLNQQMKQDIKNAIGEIIKNEIIKAFAEPSDLKPEISEAIHKVKKAS